MRGQSWDGAYSLCKLQWFGCGWTSETAYDIALMSRELITKHPEIEKYSMIWMENITHKTNKGTSEFGLSNTNKLVRHYPYATGLRPDLQVKRSFAYPRLPKKMEWNWLAVVMAAPDSKQE